MKTIAFYLPQFHEIPENDEWWGKGFTEWVTVKKARPLFKGHNQPEVPLNDNYYCLLDSYVQEDQSKIALEHGVDAFCYYHYWFDGKLLLEKPMENMLNNQNIKISFCVSWANESWARTWDGQDKKILIRQNNNEKESAWETHYKYLSKFFKDPRYLKEKNKPIILIYKPHLISNINEMVAFWNKLALKDGFDGLFWGFQHPTASNNGSVLELFDFGVEFEPLYTDAEMEGERTRLHGLDRFFYGVIHPKWLMSKLKKKIQKMPSIREYDEVWRRILTRVPKTEKMCPGAFPSWDNTPRKGSNGICFYGATPEKFKGYLAEQYKRAQRVYHSNYMFINAWNEWGEGAHLEPDKNNQYGYLEAVKLAQYMAGIKKENPD